MIKNIALFTSVLVILLFLPKDQTAEYTTMLTVCNSPVTFTESGRFSHSIQTLIDDLDSSNLKEEICRNIQANSDGVVEIKINELPPNDEGSLMYWISIPGAYFGIDSEGKSNYISPFDGSLVPLAEPEQR